MGGARAYEFLYPSEEDVVIILVEKIIEMCVYVRFLEFNRLKGMLMASEISKRKVHSFLKIIKIGKIEIAIVIRINLLKGCVDVSKRQIFQKQIFYMEKKWNCGKYTNSFANYVANCVYSNCEDLKIRWMWLFYRKYQHGIRGILKFMKKSKKIACGLQIFLSECNVFDRTLKTLIKTDNHVRIDVEIILFSKNGLISLKKIFEYYVNLFKKKIEMKITIPYVFSIFTSIRAKKLSIKTLIGFSLNLLNYVNLKNGKLTIRKLIIK